MKTLARIGLGLFLALTTIVIVSPANALCLVTIYASRAFAGGSTVVIYGSPSASSGFHYYGNTTNPIIANLLIAATSQHNRIYLQGGAASCPTTGPGRNIGVIGFAIISP